MIYRNEENGYTILRLESDQEEEDVTVVGTMPGINPGEGLSVQGQWTHHSTYGPQFKAEIVERRMPVGEKAILEYLMSGAVKGVGGVTARRLFDAFGADVLTVIEEEPQRLTEVKGITPKRAETSPCACSWPCGGCWTFWPSTGCPCRSACPSTSATGTWP